MKIAILFPNNIFTSPYLKYYLDIVEKENITYDIIIWNRSGKEEKNCIAFKRLQKKPSAFSKIYDFYKFKSFIISNLRTGQYDKIIVFSAQLGILLSNYLTKHFSGKYILDIRDYSEPISFFRNRFKKLVFNSDCVCISSKGFIEWLPKGTKYVLSHNIDPILIHKYINRKKKKTFFSNKFKLNIDTIGAIRDVESNMQLIESLKNNERFNMNFIGDGPAIPYLKKKVLEEHISNVSFLGYYKKENENSLLDKTDFINILLNNNKLSNSLTSNRLYLSALLNIPCIVNNNTEQSEIIKKYNFGIIVDNYEDIPDNLIKYKEKFDRDSFIDNCSLFLKDVSHDYELFEHEVKNFIINN